MKHSLFALALFTAWAATGTNAKAQDYPWCANYTKGSTSCSFVTFEQCMADVSGIGGFCEIRCTIRPPRRRGRSRALRLG
jgi:hypothetical protein